MIDVAIFKFTVLNCGCSDAPPGLPLTGRTYGGTVKITSSGNNLNAYVYIAGDNLNMPNGDLWIGQGGWGDGNPGTTIRLWNKEQDRNVTLGGDLIIGEDVDCSYFYAGGGTITVAGDVNIQDTGCGKTTYDNTLDAGSLNINVSGNWINNDTVTAPLGTVLLVGSSDQTITSGGSAFNNLTLNNPGSSFEINGNLDVDGTLTITAGDLDLDTNDPDVNTFSDVTIDTNGSITKGSGTWTFDGTSSFTDNSSGNPQNLGSVTID